MANLTFVDTHNMVVYLSKSDASVGFYQIVDFLNAQVIHYALMVNPTIYVSCIKQFWATASIKKVKDVAKIQALIDRKKVVITVNILHQDLRLDDADGVECLPTEEIFTELALQRGLPGMNSVIPWPWLSSALPQAAAKEKEEEDEVSAAATPPSPTHEPTPPSQEPITTPPQAQSVTPPPSPLQAHPAPPSSPP
nr:hypothetical protein [Tanacetum cinerariifolium]